MPPPPSKPAVYKYIGPLLHFLIGLITRKGGWWSTSPMFSRLSKTRDISRKWKKTHFLVWNLHSFFVFFSLLLFKKNVRQDVDWTCGNPRPLRQEQCQWSYLTNHQHGQHRGVQAPHGVQPKTATKKGPRGRYPGSNKRARSSDTRKSGGGKDGEEEEEKRSEENV